jgi:phasin
MQACTTALGRICVLDLKGWSLRPLRRRAVVLAVDMLRNAAEAGDVAGKGNMADDPFVKPEVPEAIRDLMKMSIEQAKRAFETFAATSEKTWKSLETSSQSARAGVKSLNEKIGDIMRSNAQANFALALKLAESKDVVQAMELQSDHARKQMDAFAKQLEEIRDLATQVIQDAAPKNEG